MKESCIIIGGGIGGLFTGALLAKNGVEITVLEKNPVIGGGLQSFKRGNTSFDTGMHFTGGFNERGKLNLFCRYLGIFDRLQIQHIPMECMDEIYYHKTGERYVIASGRERFIESIAAYFPEEKENIRNYVDEMYSIVCKMNSFLFNQTGEVFWPDGIMTMAADELIDKHAKDPKLKEILAYMNPLYGGIKGCTPAYVHSLLNVSYIEGASRFIGSSQQLADLLVDVIETNGGKVVLNSDVTYVDVSEGNVNYVEDKKGNRYTADKYVSAIHPAMLTKILTKGAFRKNLVERLDIIPNSVSAFSVFIDLKENTFPYIDHTCYYMEDYGLMWNQGKNTVSDDPVAFMYMTPPAKKQGKYASRLFLHILMDFEEVRKWENTVVGRRGEEYERWKEETGEKAIAKLARIYPDIYDCIRNVYTASPLTIRDYYNTKNGALFGYQKDCRNLFLSRLSVDTKVRNLYLTGQNVMLHGMSGVLLTAMITADRILGSNIIRNAIKNELYK